METEVKNRLANNLKRVFLKLMKKENSIDTIVKIFENKNGIEIGGPTPLFSKDLPIYSAVSALDGCNFSGSTVWEGSISEGDSYNFYKDKKGHQFINEASYLKDIKDGQYDFLLASHCLEHCANTLKTVEEWLRVIKPGGYILLILPDKRYTFDHKRNVTSFEHILGDFKNHVDEKDLTHLQEIVSLHDLSLDPAAGDVESFRQRSLKNYENRCLHHHVFDFELLIEIFSFLKIKPITQLFIKPYHQIIIGSKS